MSSIPWEWVNYIDRPKQIDRLPRIVAILYSAELLRTIQSSHNSNSLSECINNIEKWTKNISQVYIGEIIKCATNYNKALVAIRNVNHAIENFDNEIFPNLISHVIYSVLEYEPVHHQEWGYSMFKHSLGPEIEFKQEWRTSDTVALARNIFDNRCFELTPILADAMQDAGFDHEPTLTHLRREQAEIGNSDWALWNLLQIS